MLTQRTRQLALWGGTLALMTAAVAPGPARGQDGKPPVSPVTQRENVRDGPAPPRVKTPEQVLPGVPETASDPAPPGTRGVRVDLPPGTPMPLMANQGVVVIEGVVRRVEPGTLNGETARLLIDPAQGWGSIAGAARVAPATAEVDISTGLSGTVREVVVPRIVPGQNAEVVAPVVTPPGEAAPKSAALKAEVPATGVRPAAGINFSLTPRAATARAGGTADGIDLSDGSVTPRAGSTFDATSLNIPSGSFVEVRFRTVAGRNEVLNVNVVRPAASEGRNVETGRPTPGSQVETRDGSGSAFPVFKEKGTKQKK